MSRLIFEGDTTKRFGEKIPKPFIEEVRAYDNGLEVDIAFYFKVPNDDGSVAAFLSNLKNKNKFSQSIVLTAVDGETFNALKINKNFQDPMFELFNKSKVITFSEFLNGLETPSATMVSAINNAIIDRADIFGSTAEAQIGPEVPRFIDYAITRETAEAQIGPEVLSLTDRFDFTPPTSDSTPPTSDFGQPPSMGRELDLSTGPSGGGLLSSDSGESFVPVSYNVGIKDDFYSLEGVRYMKVFGTLEIEYNSTGEMYITCFVKNN